MKLRQASFLAVALALGACSSEGGGGPAAVLAARGGGGTIGPGGAGGYVGVYASGADVSVKPGGSMPSLPGWKFKAPSLGDNPRVITEDTFLGLAGTLEGDAGGPATGLWVKRGVTLTLYSSNPEAPYGVGLDLPAGLVVDGTLVLAQVGDTLDATSLYATAGAVSISGRVDASGGDTDGAQGGAGGTISVDVAGDCFVSGTIVTRGGEGRDGGVGGDIDLTVAGAGIGEPATTIAVTGSTDTSGGHGFAGVGGDAGYNELWGEWSSAGACNAYASGDLVARGGDGAFGGGRGGWAYVSSCASGWAVFNGLLDSSGGDATEDGPGGHADDNEVDASDGVAYATGVMRARGGRGAGEGVGGSGGWVGVSSTDTDYLANVHPTGAHVAARFQVEGGDGTSGGAAGDVELWTSIWDQASGARLGIHLHGYAGIDAAGGDGASGGSGGDVEIFADDWFDGGQYHVGNVVNEADIDVRGGRGLDGDGGGGGAGSVYSLDVSTVDDSAREVHSMGEILAQGGAGTAAGGWGGSVYAYDQTMLHASAPMNVSGGSGGTGPGGGAGSVRLGGVVAVDVRAAITATGGSSASGAGGSGGEVSAIGGAARLQAVTADGGAAPLGAGGPGGAVSLGSYDGATSPVGGTISVRGGPGAASGSVGSFWRDGALVDLVNGRFVP